MKRKDKPTEASRSTSGAFSESSANFSALGWTLRRKDSLSDAPLGAK